MPRTRSCHAFRCVAILLALAPAAGCQHFGQAMTRLAGPVEVRAQGDDEPQTVYVVSNGFHAGLVLPQSEISPEILAAMRTRRPRRFVEVGWGDEGFYRAKNITLPLVVDAVFPSPSVLHIVGFDAPVEECLPQSDIIAISLERDQFDKLCEFIHRNYVHDNEGLALPLGEGLYGQSQFFRARGNYYFPKTCNVWTAQALEAAELPVRPALSMTADGVLWQVRRFGQTVRERP